MRNDYYSCNPLADKRVLKVERVGDASGAITPFFFIVLRAFGTQSVCALSMLSSRVFKSLEVFTVGKLTVYAI